MQKILIYLLTIVYSKMIFAQATPATLYLENGDTIQTNIYTNYSNLIQLDAGDKKYSVDELKAALISGDSLVEKIHTKAGDVLAYEELNGKVDLYVSVDNGTFCYFLGKDGLGIRRITDNYKKKNRDLDSDKDRSTYKSIGTLKVYLQDMPGLNAELDKLGRNKEDVIKLIYKYNGVEYAKKKGLTFAFSHNMLLSYGLSNSEVLILDDASVTNDVGFFLARQLGLEGVENIIQPMEVKIRGLNTISAGYELFAETRGAFKFRLGLKPKMTFLFGTKELDSTRYQFREPVSTRPDIPIYRTVGLGVASYSQFLVELPIEVGFRTRKGLITGFGYSHIFAVGGQVQIQDQTFDSYFDSTLAGTYFNLGYQKNRFGATVSYFLNTNKIGYRNFALNFLYRLRK